MENETATPDPEVPPAEKAERDESDTTRSALDALPPTAAEKVKAFPAGPGVYLMKDARGRVIYVGKAKNLRNRAGHYFSKLAAEDRRTADLIREIADIDFLEAESEVDALLLEARLVKDIQPRFNIDLKDDKSFPIFRSRPASRTRASSSRAAHGKKASSSMGRSPAPRACAGRSKCCSAF
jgi:excinuclease UvrABC nuclease subunit